MNRKLIVAVAAGLVLLGVASFVAVRLVVVSIRRPPPTPAIANADKHPPKPQATPLTKESETKKVEPKPAVQQFPAKIEGPLPRRVLFIAPENYLNLNATFWYQSLEGRFPGENAMTYRFTRKGPLNIDPSQAFLLSDQPDSSPHKSTLPTRAAIKAAIKDFVDTSREQDRILVFFSGHACDIGGTGYLLPIEGDPSDKESCVAIDWIYEQFRTCKSRQKVFVLDAFRFPPNRRLELPGVGPMTEAVDRQLASPPDGVQVVTACVKDQQSLEFERGSLFQTCLLEAIRGMTLGANVQASDALPIADLVGKTDAILQIKLEGVMTETKGVMTQTCRIAGKEPESGAAPNAAEAAPKPVVLRSPSAKGQELVKGIFEEIHLIPSVAGGGPGGRVFLGHPAIFADLPNLEEYDANGFNPLSDNPFGNERDAQREKHPLRAMVRDIAVGLRSSVPVRHSTTLRRSGNGVSAEGKKQLREEQEQLAAIAKEFDELHRSARKVAKTRNEEPSKRWQLHFDLAVACLESHLVALSEAQVALSLARAETLPALDAKDVGWILVPSPELQTRDAAVRTMANDAANTWQELLTNHSRTPWGVYARRQASFPLGLRWAPLPP